MYLIVIFGLEAKKVFLKEHGAPEGTQQTQISLFLQGGRGVYQGVYYEIYINENKEFISLDSYFLKFRLEITRNLVYENFPAQSTKNLKA